MTMFMGYAAGCDGANALTLDVRLLAQMKVSGESPWKLTHLSHLFKTAQPTHRLDSWENLGKGHTLSCCLLPTL